ncbi:hypothetical protein [Staphylococcus haemolyticus]|nr:hypothetical protein [Staphylococcus haemolyticus]
METTKSTLRVIRYAKGSFTATRELYEKTSGKSDNEEYIVTSHLI